MSEARTASVFSWPVRVYYEDTDAAGIVYYASYLRFLERARSEWLRTLGVEQGGLAHAQRIAFAVTRVEADYLRPARLDDALDVTVAVEELGRARVRFAQSVLRRHETLLRARIEVACLDAARMLPTGIPAELRRRMASSSIS